MYKIVHRTKKGNLMLSSNSYNNRLFGENYKFYKHTKNFIDGELLMVDQSDIKTEVGWSIKVKGYLQLL